MESHLRVFLRDLGKLLHIPAALTLLTLPVIIYYKEWFALAPFAVMAFTSFALGQLLYQLFKNHKETAKGLSIIFVPTVWLLLPLFGIIVFYGTALTAPSENYPAVSVFNNPMNGFFEAMSGFTGTGLTMVEDPGQLPYTLQWWRTFMEWVGGIGVIMLASIFLSLNHKESGLYKAETRSWMIDDAPVNKTIKKIWWIYLTYTAASIMAFYLGGMPFWEALNHGMTAIGTGGFSVNPNSFTDYSTQLKATGVVIMTVGAISFKTHYLLFYRRDIKKLLNQTQLQYFFILLIAALLLLVWINPAVSFIDNLFQIASALGTCGLNTVDLSTWYISPLFLLVISMWMGGNAGSTAGGLKTQRIAWFTKGVWKDIKQSWLPQDKNLPVAYNGEETKPEVVNQSLQQAASIFFLYMVTLAAGSLSLSLLLGDQYSFYEVFFDATSALSNVGLSAGLTGSDLPEKAKLILTLLMWAGRLEIMAVLVLLISPLHFFRKDF